jgi:hypothetical protein
VVFNALIEACAESIQNRCAAARRQIDDLNTNRPLTKGFSGLRVYTDACQRISSGSNSQIEWLLMTARLMTVTGVVCTPQKIHHICGRRDYYTTVAGHAKLGLGFGELFVASDCTTWACDVVPRASSPITQTHWTELSLSTTLLASIAIGWPPQ